MNNCQNTLSRFGQRIRSVRSAAGLSQESFANLCDLDRTYISGIERGTRNVSIKNIEQIARAVNMTLSELLVGV